MRLIKRITSLRLIINAAVSSLPALIGALLMLALLEATFAIIAANTWGDREPTLATFGSALFSVRPHAPQGRLPPAVAPPQHSMGRSPRPANHTYAARPLQPAPTSPSRTRQPVSASPPDTWCQGPGSRHGPCRVSVRLARGRPWGVGGAA